MLAVRILSVHTHVSTICCSALGRNADAAMVEFSAALRHQVADQKVGLVGFPVNLLPIVF